MRAKGYVWVTAMQRMRFGFDPDLVWASRVNVAGKQLSREHMSGEHLSCNHI